MFAVFELIKQISTLAEKIGCSFSNVLLFMIIKPVKTHSKASLERAFQKNRNTKVCSWEGAELEVGDRHK